MGNGSQVLLLTLKNLKIKGRNRCGTCVEALFPINCLIFLVAIFIVSTSNADNAPLFGPIPINLEIATKSLAYGPNIDLVRNLMLPIVDYQEDRLYPIETDEEMTETLIRSSGTLNLKAGVFFHLSLEDIASGVLSDDITYAIRFPGKEIPNPLNVIYYVANSNDSPNLQYLAFVALQQQIDQNIMALKISEKTGVSTSVSMTASAARFPIQEAEPNFDSRWQARNYTVKTLGGTWLTFCILFTVYRLVNTIIVEKKTKVRDSMRMMGMRNEFYWLTWLVVSTFMVFPGILICSIVLKFINFFPLTDIGIVFITWFLYAISLIAVAMIFSSFLNSAKSSGILTMLALIIFSIAGELVAGAEVIPGVKILLSLFSPFAFNNIINIIAEAENLRITIDYEYSATPSQWLPSLNSMIAMLICDIVLYVLIAWYIDNVKTSGSKNRGCFCFRRSYWGSQKSFSSNEEILEDYIPTEGDFENVDELGNPVVKVKRIRKTFDINGKTFVAVDGFKLDLYEDQIVSLLGHNGAGKTTLISMLTGSLDPTSGDAEFYGNSLTKDLSALKKIVGICPQYDAIWPQLTVYEHLQLFAGFKGVKFSDIKAEADQLIKDFELEDKRNYPAGKLSGGQKRKLSIAIALIGGSKVVFLDEPSSGMDPEARRVVWDNLTRYKKGRVIILTTHFMDEADYLGDRIAIMRHGKLLCAGSSLFLKNRFGLGYTLGCVKAPKCQVDNVSEFLNEMSPNIQMLSNAGAEVIFRIPRDSFEDLPQLLTAIDSKKDQLGITSYGVGQSTLEEVFLELNNDSTQDQGLDVNLKDTVFIPGSANPSKLRQLNALLRKRLQFARRDGKFLFIQFAVPIILCLVALIVQTYVFAPNNAVNAQVAFDGKTYNSFISPWSAVDCPTNFFSALPSYTSEQFPEIPQADLQSFLGNIDNFAAGAVLNAQCSLATSSYSLQYALFFNASIPHSLPYYQNLVSNALLNTALGNSGRVSITTISQPAGAGVEIVHNLINIIIYLLILLGSSVLTASAAAYIFQERELGVKQLQLASGTNPKIYWLSNFIWDFVLHFIIFFVIFFIANAVSWSTFGGVRIAAEIILIILYSLSSVSIAYFFSFVFSSPGSGIGSLMGLFIGIGFGFLAIINAIGGTATDATEAISALGYVFKAFSPHYLLLSSLGQLSNSFGSDPLNPVDETTDIFQIQFWGSSFVIFAGQFLAYGGFTLLFEEYTQLRLKRQSQQNDLPRDEDEDDDVANERDAVDSANATDRENNLVWVRGLRKEFNAKKKIHKVAVNNFSLHIPRGESFGLLGANGAGKTTTLKMLSGQLLPSCGEVSINGNTYQQLNGILQSIGFCPQFDSVMPKLSGRAHLELFAEIRGLPKEKVPSIVGALIKMINLTKYADRPCGKYSGGNKRKLSLALALIGNPPVLYLDEPSTGMDPLARRFMWNLIMAVRSNKAVILTTHSMEECEALCTRVGIMISGRLQCVGSPQHLKTKFGNGYRLELKTDMQHVDEIPKFISKLAADAKLIDNHTTLFSYEIPMHNLTLGQLLERVESVKDTLKISDYSVSQTSLEQIFITMAQDCAHPKIVIEK